jgi:hypothetical protein
MKKFRTLFLLVFVVTACKSFEFSTLNFKETNNKKLPHLNIEIDEYSLVNSFSVESTQGTVNYSNYGGTFHGTTTLDPRIQDAKVLFERETYSNICEEKGNAVGSIKYEIPIIDKKNKLGGIFISSITLFIPSLLGVTQATYEVQMEVTTSILDHDGNLINKYTSNGFGKEKCKLYGYNGTDAKRLASIAAIKMALESNRLKISKDYDFINKQLFNK